MDKKAKNIKVFRAHCRCGGELKNEVLWAISEDKELIVYGLCDRCLSHTIAKIPLIDLNLAAPLKDDTKGNGHN